MHDVLHVFEISKWEKLDLSHKNSALTRYDDSIESGNESNMRTATLHFSPVEHSPTFAGALRATFAFRREA
jgi:hypothetical protein